MRVRSPSACLASAVAFVLVAACGSTREAADPPRGSKGEQAITDRLAYVDPQIAGEGESRFLEVTVRNQSDARVAASCAPEWIDAQSAVVHPARDWHDVDLPPGGEVRLRFTGMPATARSWYLRFRP